MESSAPPPNPRLGPYQLGLLLGEGGMGEVYKAFDDRLGRWVAVKRVRGNAGEKAKERFRREARTLAQLGHPGIVQIFDWLQDDDGDWIVMELIDGPTLAELRRSGPLLPALVVDYGRQIASALSAAHGSGVIHRDLKTENVMVLPSGHIKVLDFGLAWHQAAESNSVDLTLPHEEAGAKAPESRPRRIVGTPRAMSPEQALGRELDARSDLFSLGVLLYELLTARSPFSGRHLTETLRRVVEHRPPAAQRLNPMVPRRLSQLVDCLLEKEPAHRPGSAAELEEALKAMTSEAFASATEPGLSQVETLGTTLDTPMSDRENQSTPSQPTHDTVVVTTLLVSDLVGSTQLVERLGDRGAAALFQRHDRLARDLMQEHDGREIDKTEGFLLLFDRPWSAVAYALAYHRALGSLELQARVGIHLGEVVLHRNAQADIERGAKPLEVEGLAKPTAARLMSLAMGGQTLLTRAAYEVARRGSAGLDDGEAELQWPCHGRYTFQGLDGAVEVFEVGSPGSAPLSRPLGSEKARRIEASPSLDARLAAARADLQPRALVPSDPPNAAVTLRPWPPPELPEQPYPVLLPYTHPDWLAGRDAEISKLWRMLEMQVPILGLSAPSGTGKSSLLMGGLVPLLRAAGVPVAVVRYPAEAGLASRLIGDLLDGGALPAEHDPWTFVDRLVEVERLAGAPAVLVLDQFEDVLRSGAGDARKVLGLLMAASLTRRPGLSAPPCRWLIAYRREFYGRVRGWLSDVLREARTAELTVVGALPHDLSGPERFHRMALAPLATPPPGEENNLEASTKVFLAAIEAPLAEPSPPSPLSRGRERGDRNEGAAQPVARFPWFFRPGHAERLAQAFAEARLARPDAPLTPELQVVLAHLLSRAAPDGSLSVPEDAGSLVDQALDEHLRRALEGAFPADSQDGPTRRARALLALRELATVTGRRDEGLSSEQLARAIGEGGKAILGHLSTPQTRLVWVREAPDGLRWTLSHDRLAEAVVRLVDEEGRQGRLMIDGELLALRRFVTLRTELFRLGQPEAATRVSRSRFQRIQENAEALLWDDERRSWFAACTNRRRSDHLRLAALSSLAALLLMMIGFGVWTVAERLAEHQHLLDLVAGAEPEEAFQAIHRLSSMPAVDSSELLALLKQRDVPLDILEWGLSGLEEPERATAVLRIVEMILPWVERTPEDFVLIASMVWALDFSPGRDPALAGTTQTLRDRVLEPLRELRPPPPKPGPDDPDWMRVPPGRFLMGTAENEKGSDDERPQHEVAVDGFRMLRHEVTVAQYRRLVPGHQPDAADNLPVTAVSWYSVYTYAAWLGGRLPTEAEWEYAARAGCNFAYCTRNGAETSVDSVAWTLRSSRYNSAGELIPNPVMELEPNPWGLHDMFGNLWEWTMDVYGAYPETGRLDAWGPASGDQRRVLRGGSFSVVANQSRPADRYGFSPGVVSMDRGLRVVLPNLPSRGNGQDH